MGPLMESEALKLGLGFRDWLGFEDEEGLVFDGKSLGSNGL